MTTMQTCPKCGRQLSQESSQPIGCPQCQQDALSENRSSKGVSPWVVIKAIIAFIIGMIPGALFLKIGQPLPLCILIMVLGAFIGLAFTLAKISAGNVARLTAGSIVAYNVPRPLRGAVIDAFTGSGDGGGEKGKGSSEETGPSGDKRPESRPN